jgi:hypothetical protein
MLGSNPARDSQVRTGEWPIQAPTESPAGAVFLHPHLLVLRCLRKPDFRHVNSDGFAAQAASAIILSSFSLAPFAQPCQRGIVIDRASRYTSSGTSGSPPSLGINAQCGRRRL